MEKISIVMPAYNEEKNIENTIRKCYDALKKIRLHGEIIVIDDGSKDKTGIILNQLKKEISNLRLILHKTNMGYGKSISDGIRAAKGHYVITLDSDGQFDIYELPLFLSKIKNGYDVVTGYRKRKKDTFLKVLANKVLNNIVKYLFKIKIKDVNCSFRIYKKDIFKKINMEASHFILPTEILIKANALSYKIAEIGVTHSYREKGKSSIKLFKNTVETLIFLLKLKRKINLYNKRFITSL